MQSPAPLVILLQAQIPLNSLCDRCESLSLSSKTKNHPSFANPYASQLAQLFITILSQKRMMNQFLKPLTEPQNNPIFTDNVITSSSESIAFNQNQETSSKDSPEKGVALNIKADSNNTLSLEDIEAMLSESNEDRISDVVDDDDQSNHSHLDSERDNKEVNMIHEDSPKIKSRENLQPFYSNESINDNNLSMVKITPWTPCNYWEPCAIGTLLADPL